MPEKIASRPRSLCSFCGGSRNSNGGFFATMPICSSCVTKVPDANIGNIMDKLDRNKLREMMGNAGVTYTAEELFVKR